VLSIGSTGDVQTLIPSSAGIHVAESLAVAPDGSLFIGDNDEDTLYVREQDGAIRVAVPAAEGFSPEGLYHSGRALFITDRKNGKLYRYTPEEGLKTLIVFAGDLAKIQGVAGDPQGNIYVTIQADIKEGRGYILRLSPTGESAGRHS
jgi:glucose/arabinose dehydrogenase